MYVVHHGRLCNYNIRMEMKWLADREEFADLMESYENSKCAMNFVCNIIVVKEF